MKNNNLLKIAFTLFWGLFLIQLTYGQRNYSTVSMIGPEFKLVQKEKHKRFAVKLEIGKLFPSQKGIENYNGGGVDSLLSMIYSDPQLLEKLFESLGGEFFIGSFSEAPEFENFRQSGDNVYSISGAFRIHPSFDVMAQFVVYKTKVTADFPIVVFDELTYDIRSAKGLLTTDLCSRSIQFSGNYYPFKGIVQPLIGAGTTVVFTKSIGTHAKIGDQKMDMPKNTFEKSLGVLFNAGVKIMVFKNGFIQIDGQMFSVSSPNGNKTSWNKMLSFGAGVQF